MNHFNIESPQKSLLMTREREGCGNLKVYEFFERSSDDWCGDDLVKYKACYHKKMLMSIYKY